MAYDQNSAYGTSEYVAPTRAYLAQKEPQPSVPYSNSYHDQYEQYNQVHQGSGYDYRHDQRPARLPQRYDDEGYARGYGGQQSADQDYQQHEERAYDPRYQPRAPRAQPPQLQPGIPSSLNGQPPPARDARQGIARDTAQQHEQTWGQSQRQRGPKKQHNPYPPPAHHTANSSSMDEWKAREKVRMKQKAISPEVLPFDNAFPVFGKKDSRQGAGTTDQRASGERTRPHTSGSNRPRPATSRGTSHQSPDDVHVTRPDMDRQHSSLEFASNREDRTFFDQEAHTSHPPQGAQPRAENYSTPIGREYPDQWPMVVGQTPPKFLPQDPSPPHCNEHDSYSIPNTRDVLSQPNYGQYDEVSEQHRLPEQRGRPFIDTSQAQNSQRPVYTEPSPLSSANVPPRPSTSQGQHSQPGQQFYSFRTEQPQSAITQTSYEYPPKPWAQEQHTRHGSLDDIYADYAITTNEQKPLSRAPTTREEEIEAEMPDFDSAAPGQTSNLQKRTQGASGARGIPPLTRTQTAPPSQMPQSRSAQDLSYGQSQPSHSYSVQDVRPNQQRFEQSGPRPGPASKPRGLPRRGMTTDGQGGYAAPIAAQERQYGISYGQTLSHDSQYQTSGRQQMPSSPPPKAPYAGERQVQRSFDEARQMPYRQGPPPPQRFYQNGQPPREGYTQQRPDMNSTGQQSGWSNPTQGWEGNPYRGPQEPTRGTANGAPTSQQISAVAKSSNPDALPHHPVPVRAGHVLPGQSQRGKPPPVRNNKDTKTTQNAGPHQREPSADHFAQLVTHAELDRLRAGVEDSKSPRQELILVKKLVEAASVLANESGRVDAKTAGKNRERFINEAYKRLKKLVAAGYPDAQFYMADCHGQGSMGLEVDTKEAFKLYQAAAKAGHPQAAYRTAVCCEMGPEAGGGTSKDYPKAVQWYRRAATLSDAAAMYKLGAILLKGLLGQQRNVVEAVNWLKRGAEKADKENPHALHELAMLYESTNTNMEIRNKVLADDGYARELFQQAAQLGYKFSQFRLGQAYEYGNLGLPIDNRSSIAWYTKAAAQGEHQAELALSGWYLTGAEGILEHSETEAYLWARKAASSEPPLAKAMFAMGYFTENGIGCPESLMEARKWYGRAASYKFPKAVERLEELKKSGGKAGTKNETKPPPMNGKLTRKDQKRDEENCVVM